MDLVESSIRKSDDKCYTNWSMLDDLLQESGEAIARHHVKGSPIDKDLLVGLGVVFGPDTVHSALELIDNRAVTIIQMDSSKDRRMFKVRGSSRVSYTILCPIVNRCPCAAWSLSTWGAGPIRGQSSKDSKTKRIPRTTCKHVLAAILLDHISEHMETGNDVRKLVELVTVSEETFVEMIASMD